MLNYDRETIEKFGVQIKVVADTANIQDGGIRTVIDNVLTTSSKTQNKIEICEQK